MENAVYTTMEGGYILLHVMHCSLKYSDTTWVYQREQLDCIEVITREYFSYVIVIEAPILLAPLAPYPSVIWVPLFSYL